MTRIETALKALGWSNTHAADLLGCNERNLRRWRNEEMEPPEAVVIWLEKLAAAWVKIFDKHPAPEGWKRRE